MRKNYPYETLFVIIALAALYTGLSLFSYNEADPSYSNIVFSRYNENVNNIFGKTGAYTADLLGITFGWCALFIPFALIYILFQMIKLYRGKISRARAVGALFSAAVFICFVAILNGIIGGNDMFFKKQPSGGILGVAGGIVIASLLGRAGGGILCSIILLASFMGIIRVSLTEAGQSFLKIAERIKNNQKRIEPDEERKSLFERVAVTLKEVKDGQNQIELDVERKSLFERAVVTFKKVKDGAAERIALMKTGKETEKLRRTELQTSESVNPTPLNETTAAPVAELHQIPETDEEQPIENYPPKSGEPQIIAEGFTADIPGITPPPLVVPPFSSDSSEEAEYEEPEEYREEYENIEEADKHDILKELGLRETEKLMTVSELEKLLYNKDNEEEENEDDDYDSAEIADDNEDSAPEAETYTQPLPPEDNIKSAETYKDYNIPFSLLDLPDNKVKPPEREELQAKADTLLNKLRDFGIDGRISEMHPGPVVTLFEFEPAPGIKINKIANLEVDLALAMSALKIRIIAPIPGKAAVGIEIPNPERAMVSLRELLETKEYLQDNSPLSVALGKDISGKPYFTDLRKMPHLLVAGTTGSGKSVCVNSIICSILYKSAPDKVKLVMVDPKVVELSVYEKIPHLAAPVVTDPRKASAVLKNVVKEMETRYTLLASCKVRSIDSYNDYIQANQGNAGEVIPYMVVIVDEFADLMMVAGKEVENSIMRIAQMARAVGIHLVLATQRPTVNVITGSIKTNIPVRISFRVPTKMDSRTILDQNGAEQLLGSGDSLFVPPGASDTLRIHGCFVSEKEVLRIVDELKKYGEPEYDMALLEEQGESGFDDDANEENDPLFDEALNIAAEKDAVSISMIQRYLKIGYNRAARIVEMMERKGYIAPSDGTGKPRKLLKKD
ncbi:MAG: DNA translocase FtsK [Deferribacteraceae bacterium]|jgi:S-DNA-T family DNA segregation ATPase FtsK/SpoIIIE|nr:DNA translocase FtsK [Deferribacteraceae bacterium]